METIEYDISPFEKTNTAIFVCLRAAINFGLVPVFLSALLGAREPGSQT